MMSLSGSNLSRFDSRMTVETGSGGSAAAPETHMAQYGPPLFIALLTFMLYVASATIGYQLHFLTVDQGRICLMWLPFAISILMARNYGGPAYVGLALGAFVAGSGGPFVAPFTATMAAFANVFQVAYTVKLLERPQTQGQRWITAWLKAAFVAFVAAFTTLVVSMLEGQRTWPEVGSGTISWVAGDLLTLTAVLLILNRIGLRFDNNCHASVCLRRSPQNVTDDMVCSVKRCLAFVNKVFFWNTSEDLGVQHWIDEWIGTQRTLRRPECAIRPTALAFLCSEIPARLMSPLGLFSTSIENWCVRCCDNGLMASMPHILVMCEFAHWLFIGYWREE